MRERRETQVWNCKCPCTCGAAHGARVKEKCGFCLRTIRSSEEMTEHGEQDTPHRATEPASNQRDG